MAFAAEGISQGFAIRINSITINNRLIIKSNVIMRFFPIITFTVYHFYKFYLFGLHDTSIFCNILKHFDFRLCRLENPHFLFDRHRDIIDTLFTVNSYSFHISYTGLSKFDMRHGVCVSPFASNAG